jgi:nitrogen PTS system EIIA component
VNLSELLTPERVHVARRAGFDKKAALASLASLLAHGGEASVADVARILEEREALKSTGIGEGVAIPHGALSALKAQFAALLIVPSGVDFQAIDNTRVSIFFGVIGPKGASGEHLKTLARIARLLRSDSFRTRLIASSTGAGAYALVQAEEAR